MSQTGLVLVFFLIAIAYIGKKIVLGLVRKKGPGCEKCGTPDPKENH